MYKKNNNVKHYFRTIAVLAVSLMVSALVPSLKADGWDKRTNFTIDQAIDVEGTVLPPGSYVMKLLSTSPDRYTVQIFNARENHLFTTIIAIPTYRPAITADTEFSFYDVVAGQPRELRTWFYPGDNVGYEFGADRGATAAQSGRRHTNPPASNAGAN
jgi:hypothetical protein